MITRILYLLCTCVTIYAKNYDYIVVGSGTAGSVVANRLSENPFIQVLLLEAGGEPNLLTDVPLFSETLRLSPISWNYTTVPLKNAGFGLTNRVSNVPRGKVLGGTSMINANLYTRGNRKDYDTWAAEGAIGWDWENVFPYFLKHEDNGDPYIASNGYHYVGGDQPVNFSPFYLPITKDYLKSAERLGYAIGDYNGKNQSVFMAPQGSIKNGRRWSSLKSFIDPIRGRRNIDILISAHVTKILIDGNKRAYGVEFERHHHPFKAIANEEVILCAGVFNSAQLLMLSGIGPKEELVKFNIPVISNLPVGKNLQDHVTTFGLLFKVDTFTYRQSRITNEDYNAFLSYGLGPFTSMTAVETIGFIKSNIDYSMYPDLEIAWGTASIAENETVVRTIYNVNRATWEALEPYSKLDVVQCYPYVLKPKSIGKMWLASANPYDPPIIDPNYYSEKHDINLMVKGMKFCLEMGSQEPMRKKGATPIPVKFPGCEPYPVFSDDYLACVAKVATVSFDHFSGTCKMGDPNDPTTVVDPFLRVKGIGSLRVVDASVMPIITSGHTYAPASMIGEKGADLILRDLLHRRQLHISIHL